MLHCTRDPIMRLLRFKTVLVIGALAMASCSATGSTDHAQSAVIDSAPSGYALQAQATGPLSTATAAAQATTASTADTEGQLNADGFIGGYARVWTTAQKFLTIVALDFDSVAHASTFTAFEVDTLENAGTAYLTPEGTIAGASAYVLTAPTHAGGAQLFCEGVWMSVGITSIDTVTCSSTPASAALAEQVALDEYHTAQRVDSSA